MSAIQTFLSELQKRIDAVSSQVIDFENEKNTMLLIDNILYKYSLDKNNITSDDLINLSEEDLKVILSIKYKDDELNGILSLIKVNSNIIRIYNNLKDKYGDVANASQYNEAKNYMDQLANLLSSELGRFLERNKAYVEATKKSIEIPKKYLNLFIGDKLNAPIFDLNEFNNLVDNIGLSISERADLKKEVGKANYDLVMSSFKSKDDTLLAKYYAILTMKKKKYLNTYEQIKNEDISISNANAKLDELTAKGINYSDCKQAITCILLEKALKEYNDVINNKNLGDKSAHDYLNTLTNVFEDIITFSRKHEHKKDEPSKEEASKNEKNKEINPDDEIISKTEKILTAEKALINSIDSTKLDMYLAQNIDKDTDESIKYKIVSILMEALTSLNQFKEVLKTKDDENYKYNHDKYLGELRKYIESYENLKASIKEKEEKMKEPFKIIYLKDENKKPIIKDDLKNKDIDDLINDKLKYGIIADAQKLDLENKSVAVYSKEEGNAKVCFIRLANNIILVLCALYDNDLSKVNTLIEKYKKDLNELIIKAQDVKEISKLDS
jgi:hypothetical protein